MNAPHDQNTIKAKLGVLCTDGTTLVPIAINPSNGGIKMDVTSTLLVPVTENALRDENYQYVWLGQNSVTGETCPIYVNADGGILVDF